MKKIIAFCATLFMLFCIVSQVKAAEPTGNSYFYNGEGQAIVCPQPYIVQQVLGYDLNLQAPVAMRAYEEQIYILDADGHILVLDADYQQVEVIEFTKDGAPYSFQEVKGMWIAKNEIFIADRGGGVVVRADIHGTVSVIYTEPLQEGEEPSGAFFPTGVVTDSLDNIYIMVENEYRGLVTLDADGEFRGYFGANTVEVTADVLLDNLWRKYFLSETQISYSSRNLPSPYLAVTASNGFVYASNTGASNKIRKLNYNGNNILSPSGSMGTYDSESKSRFIALDTDQLGFITALDSEKKQVFQYDSEGNLLYTFGGLGNIEGSFVEPTAICCVGDNVMVLDASTGLVTVFVPSEFGSSVRTFRALDIEGRYEDASVEAQKTLALCNEYEAAYYSIGQNAYSNEQYATSMEYFRLCNSQAGYSKAFEGRRIEVLTRLFPYLVIGIILLAVVLKLTKHFRNRTEENILFTTRKDMGIRIKYAWYTVFHPIEGYAEMRYTGLYSFAVANVLYALGFLSTSVKYISSGYSFSTTDASSYNLFICLAQSIGVLVLFVVCSRLTATFLGGIATLKELWITVGYAQIPVIIVNVLYTILSNVLTQSEGVFLGYLLTIAVAYSYVMMFFAVMNMHMYSFKTTVWSVICTIFGMLVCIFLIFLMCNLGVELMSFFETLWKEIIFRINYGF